MCKSFCFKLYYGFLVVLVFLSVRPVCVFLVRYSFRRAQKRTEKPVHWCQNRGKNAEGFSKILPESVSEWGKIAQYKE